MDAAVDATPFGAWASIRGYFTPATLFLALNLVIGTIALTSRSHQRRRRDQEHHEHHPQQAHYQEPQLDHHYYQPQTQQHQYYATPPPQPPAPLARTSSVLDRLRSIGLYRFRSGDFPPEYGAPPGAAPGGTSSHDAPFPPVEEEQATKYARSRSEPAPAREAPPRMKKSGTKVIVRKTQAVRAPATRRFVAVDERADQEFIGSLKPDEPSSPQKAEYLPPYQEEYVPPPAPMRAPPPLSRTSSVLDRLRSLGLYSFLGVDQRAAAATPTTDGLTSRPAGDKKQPPAHAHYDRSRSEAAREEQGEKEKKKQAAEARMAKSSSTTRKAAAAPSLAAEEDCVDARAEAFIDSFRKEQSQKQQVHHDEDDHVVPPPPAPLARTSSVLDRLRSFSLYLRSVEPVPKDPYNKVPAADEKKQSQYARSRSELTGEQVKKKKAQGTQARMSKTSSEAAAASSVAEEAAPAGECVDARADDFINKFRQQLQLQRLDSLLNYKDVLNRGSSKQ